MGKTGSKLSQALGFGSENPLDENGEPLAPRPPQWDTTIDQLFGDAPPDENVIEPPPILDSPIRPKRRRSPAARRKHSRGCRQPSSSAIVPEIPRRVATGVAHAINAPKRTGKRSVASSASIIERNIPKRGALTSSFQRRQPSVPRRGCPEFRKQHLVSSNGIFPSNFAVRNILEDQGLGNHSRNNVSSTAKCSTCETFAPLRLCRHCNFMICDRCLRAHRLGLSESNQFSKRSNKTIQFYIAVRKVTPSESQVKRLTIDMPMDNYLHDSCQTLIERIAQREQLYSVLPDLVLEFGDQRLLPQRTLASYGIQTGDLLFLFNPERRLDFLSYNNNNDVAGEEDDQISINNPRLRTTTTTTSNDWNRRHHNLSPISDEN